MAGFALSGAGTPQKFIFANQSTINITHGLGYRPMVYIMDTAGKLIGADITHNSRSSITILLASNLSGTIFLR